MGDGKENTAEETGFNDAELEEIMDEIENLESTDDAPSQPSSPAAELSTPAEPVEEVVEETPSPAPQNTNVVEMSPAPAGGGSSTKSRMSFHVQGDMQVDLDFHVAGETIKLTLDGSDGLVIGLNSGAKFCVPLSGAGAKRKAG